MALFFYLFFNVIGVLLLWIFFNFKTKNISIKKDEDYIWRCSICANVYVDSINDDMSKCPQCSSFNSKKGREKI